MLEVDETEHGAFRPLPRSVLRATGELLRDHVRTEERELFPLLEDRLGPSEIEALGERLRRAGKH